jgi:hypothetical protein
LRTLRIWLALCCSVALVVTFAVGVAFAQIAPGNPLETEGFVDASGGSGGSALGGDGGRGGTGTGPICNQSTNDVFETDAWDEEGDPTVACGAGGGGGDGGDAGESIGGRGGFAFGVGPPPAPEAPPTIPEPIRRLLADLFVRQRAGSFIITVGNNGPDPAQGAHLVSTFSGNGFAHFGSVETTKGSCTEPTVGADLSTPQTVTCDFGDLAVGELVTVTIDWSPGECGSTATNTAVVSDAGPSDPDLTNNANTLSEHRGPTGC